MSNAASTRVLMDMYANGQTITWERPDGGTVTLRKAGDTARIQSSDGRFVNITLQEGAAVLEGAENAGYTKRWATVGPFACLAQGKIR